MKPDPMAYASQSLSLHQPHQSAYMPPSIKDAMACFGTGVTVITTHHEGQDWGMTCNSFNTVSLDPAMVLWSIRKTSQSRAAFEASDGYTVNILSTHQHALAMRFTQGTQTERFAGTEMLRTEGNHPRIADTLAWFRCALESSVSAGDHLILIGRVLEYGITNDSQLEPLLYAKRAFGSLKPKHM
ncbi:MAG: flavin reductase family protein [Burkholderiaceae bacterium]